MAGTHHMLLYHFVFSTKRRQRWIDESNQDLLFDYIGGTIRNLGGISIRVGGWLDHVHVLAKLKTTHCVADFMRQLKSGTAKHFNQQSSTLRKFGWQDGYGAFTVSPFRADRVVRYIENQHEHHRTEDSRTEYLRILDAHGVEYDLRYVDE